MVPIVAIALLEACKITSTRQAHATMDRDGNPAIHRETTPQPRILQSLGADDFSRAMNARASQSEQGNWEVGRWASAWAWARASGKPYLGTGEVMFSGEVGRPPVELASGRQTIEADEIVAGLGVMHRGTAAGALLVF